MQIPSSAIVSQWPAPNLTNPETQGPAAIIITSLLLGLVTILLAIRIYTRVWISKGFGLDDILILFAYVPVAGFAALSFVAQTKFHWGRHVWDIPLNDIPASLQTSLALQLLFDVATSLTKLSMLALIYRVVSVDNSRYRYVVIFVAALVSLDALIFFFITLFQCSPPSAYWTLSTTPQACINEEEHLLAAGCINTITDFLIVLVPIPYVRQLKLPRKQQLIIASLFAGGVFATAAGAVRTAVTTRLFTDPLFDMTWNSIPVVIATSLELNIGLICASIPPTKPFFTRVFPQLLGNPITWMSRRQQSQSQRSNKRRDTDADFWLVTKVQDDDTAAGANHHYDDLEAAPPLVMTMRNSSSIIPTSKFTAGATPMRPPRTQSTLRALSAYYHDYPSTTTTAHKEAMSMSSSSASSPRSSSSNSSYATTIATAILGPSNKAPDLNKPLPTLRPSSASDLAVERSRNSSNSSSSKRVQDVTSMNMMSIYQFVPHEDGHISVHKARKSAFSVS